MNSGPFRRPLSGQGQLLAKRDNQLHLLVVSDVHLMREMGAYHPTCFDWLRGIGVILGYKGSRWKEKRKREWWGSILSRLIMGAKGVNSALQRSA